MAENSDCFNTDNTVDTTVTTPMAESVSFDKKSRYFHDFRCFSVFPNGVRNSGVPWGFIENSGLWRPRL